MKNALRISTKAFWVLTALICVLILSQAAFATPGCDVIGGWPGAQYGGKNQILTDTLPCYGTTGTKDSPVVLQEAPTLHNPHFTGVVNCPTCGSGGAVVTNGSWTPTLIGSTTAGSPVYASQVGQWSRVGDQVTIWFRVQITTPGAGAAGTAVVAGLPYPPITGPGQGYIGTPGPMSYVSHTTGYSQFAVQIKDTSGITVQELGDDVIISNMAIGNVHANAIVGGTVVYRTSAP